MGGGNLPQKKNLARNRSKKMQNFSAFLCSICQKVLTFVRVFENLPLFDRQWEGLITLIARIMRYCITLILTLLGVGMAFSQNSRTEIDSNLRVANSISIETDAQKSRLRINKNCTNIEVHFKLDDYNLELDYMGNEASLQDFAHKVDSIGIEKIDSVVIVSQSSPEGAYKHNLFLSENRANTIRRYILDKHPDLKEHLRVYPDGESWDRLRDYVERDTLMTESVAKRVISIIDSDVNVATKKWQMAQLSIYRYLLTTYYPRIRNSSFCILYYSDDAIIEAETLLKFAENRPDPTEFVVPMAPEEKDEWNRKLDLKTNLVGWGFGVVNAAVDIDLAKHLSLTLPIYYSAWDYFKTTIKFRTLTIQPELRFWPSRENKGFFVGAHFGMAYYNMALDGDYRYQDHNRETPSLGGGVGIGYRLPISKSGHWRMEFTLGAGVYSRYYDIFHNTPVTKDGVMTESVKKTYWGVDQAAISFSYAFDLKKRGGKR
jgi:hypothetical protein